MEDKRKCPDCGTTNQPSNHYCFKCGARLTDLPVSFQTCMPEQEIIDEFNRRKKRSQISILLLPLCLILTRPLLVIVGEWASFVEIVITIGMCIVIYRLRQRYWSCPACESRLTRDWPLPFRHSEPISWCPYCHAKLF
jgi:hypothetical protein